MWIEIDGERLKVTEVFDGGYLPDVVTERCEFYVARSSKAAGEAARQYWQDMAEDDPREFTAIVGEATLVAWALGQYAGPGTTHVTSLEEWLDLWLDIPEEEFARYDFIEREVESSSRSLQSLLGFRPTVAYRRA